MVLVVGVIPEEKAIFAEFQIDKKSPQKSYCQYLTAKMGSNFGVKNKSFEFKLQPQLMTEKNFDQDK